MGTTFKNSVRLKFPLDFFSIMCIIFLMKNNIEGRVWAEIYLDRLIDNYHLVKKMARKSKVMAAIKADAYGHGAIEVAKTLQPQGVDMFGVASVEEGIELRESGINSEVLILSPILYEQIDETIKYNLIPTISEFSFFKKLTQRLRSNGNQIPVHIEIDTGMTRTGISYDDATHILGKIIKSRFVKIEGIFSHFPVADCDGTFSKNQIERFTKLISNLRKNGIQPNYVHIANSAGIFVYPDSHFNLVRPGISLYGLAPSSGFNLNGRFMPVMALRSRIVNLRDVDAHIPISYGHTFRTKRKSRIATVSVGYGDGYPRMLSNIGEVLCQKKRAKIVGAICMDLMMIDVTNIPNIHIGDIVTLIGKDGNEEITVEELAMKCRTIVYEVTSGIGPRVARVFKNNNKVVGVRTLLGRWKNER